MKFWDDAGDPSSFPTLFPDCRYHVSPGDVGPQTWHWVAKSSKIDSFGIQIMLGPIPKKNSS